MSPQPTPQPMNQPAQPAPQQPQQPSSQQPQYPSQPAQPTEFAQQPLGQSQQPQTQPGQVPPQTQGAQPQYQDGAQPSMVYVARSPEPAMPEISTKVQERHKQSLQQYPFLNLTEGEYVIKEVRRHMIGLVPIVGLAVVLVLLLAAAVAWYPTFLEQEQMTGLPSTGVVALLATLFGGLILAGAYVAVYVYMKNKFFLTNESVIQELQYSIFSRHEQTVSLANVEDVSYRQDGILPFLLNYGSIRLSTEGDETTYRFRYVAQPKRQVAILNNAVEAFKNGRPIQED